MLFRSNVILRVHRRNHAAGAKKIHPLHDHCFAQLRHAWVTTLHVDRSTIGVQAATIKDEVEHAERAVCTSVKVVLRTNGVHAVAQTGGEMVRVCLGRAVGTQLESGGAGDAEEAVKAFEKVIAKWPTNDFGAFARSEVCKIYWRLGKPEKWSPHMEYLATGDYIDPQNLRAASQHRYLMHLLMSGKTADGYALVDKVRKKDALVTFASWTADAMHNHHIPTFYGEKGTKARGTVAADAVAFIEKQPTADAAQKASLEHWCARIFAYAGETAKATERFAALTKKNPDSDEIRGEYAAYLRTSGKRGEARLVYRELKDQYVADREIAETYGEETNWKSCVEAYQAMLTKHPKQSDAIQWRLGEVLNRIGKYQEAIACYNQANREPQSLFRIADCQGALKQHDAAIQTLVGVLNFFKSSAAEAQYRIAGHYAAKGDKEAAIRTLKTVCKVHLNTSWAGQAHQDLSQKYGIDVTLGGAAKKEEK